MRRLFLLMVVAAATALVPLWALAGNQEVAEQIAANLRESGQLRGYSIGVKYQDGTVWLRGRVASREQMDAALKLVFQTAGVSRVVNNLTMGAGTESVPAEAVPTNPARDPSLQQAAGAVAPDRNPQSAPPVSWRVATLQQPQVETVQTPVGGKLSTATPVETSFTHEAAQPASAMSPSEPTLASTLLTPRPDDNAPTTLHLVQTTPAVQTAAPQPIPDPALQMTIPAMAPPAPMPPPATPQAAQAVAIATQTAPSVATTPQATPAVMAQPMLTRAVMGAPLAIAAAPATPIPAYVTPVGGSVAPVQYDQPYVPNYAWPGYAAYPNYAALTYPKQYSPTAWPYIGPFYPYPQVPLGWRKVSLEWHDGWWNLDFDDGATKRPFSGLFRPQR